jgi:hypothetical protein
VATWIRKAPGVFCKKAYSYEASVVASRSGAIIKRTRIGRPGKGLCSFKKSLGFSPMDISYAEFVAGRTRTYISQTRETKEKLSSVWQKYKGKTITKRLSVVAYIHFKDGVHTLGSNLHKKLIKYVNVVWHFVEVKKLPTRFKRFK